MILTFLKYYKKIPITDYVYNNKSIKNTTHLKKRLIAEGFLREKCVWCGNKGQWFNKPITLELDHINGNRKDNNLSNLRILCPNCHSQTSTFRGKNK